MTRFIETPTRQPWLVIPDWRESRAGAAAGYLIAVVVTALSFATQQALVPWVTLVPFILFFLGVFVAALLGGHGPGFLAIVLSAILGNYHFLPPERAWAISREALALTSLFLVVASVMSLVAASLRNALRERATTELVLRQQKQELNRAQAVAKTGSWRLDTRRNVLTWSDETHRMFGISSDTVLDYQRFLAAVHPDDRDDVDRAWRAALAGAPYEIEHRIVVGDEVKWVRERAELDFDERGRVLGGFGTAQDITESKRAAEALVEADRRKNEFLAVLSHELRNPLTPMRNSVFILERAQPGGEQARRALSIIDRQLKHLLRLIDDLLDVTRIARGKIRVERAPVDLVGLIERTLEDHRPQLSAAGVELSVALPPAPLWLSADATRIGQVIGNLLTNAAKFTPRGGRVELPPARGARTACS